MQAIRNNPVTFVGWVLSLALATLTIAAYYLKLTPEEVAMFGTFLTIASGGLHYWLGSSTVPVTDLESVNGKPVSTGAIRGGQAVINKGH